MSITFAQKLAKHRKLVAAETLANRRGCTDGAMIFRQQIGTVILASPFSHVTFVTAQSGKRGNTGFERGIRVRHALDV